MEENLDINNEVNKEMSDNTTETNYKEIKVPKLEKDINMDKINGDSQNNSASEVVKKNEMDIPVNPITKPFIWRAVTCRSLFSLRV